MVLHVPPTVTDPLDALDRIRKACPRADSKKLLAIYRAVVIDSRQLQAQIIERSFAIALEQLTGQKTPVAPPPQM